MKDFVNEINNIIWSPALILLLVCAGLYFSISGRLFQEHVMPHHSSGSIVGKQLAYHFALNLEGLRIAQTPVPAALRLEQGLIFGEKSREACFPERILDPDTCPNTLNCGMRVTPRSSAMVRSHPTRKLHPGIPGISALKANMM